MHAAKRRAISACKAHESLPLVNPFERAVCSTHVLRRQSTWNYCEMSLAVIFRGFKDGTSCELRRWSGLPRQSKHTGSVLRHARVAAERRRGSSASPPSLPARSSVEGQAPETFASFSFLFVACSCARWSPARRRLYEYALL